MGGRTRRHDLWEIGIKIISDRFQMPITSYSESRAQQIKTGNVISAADSVDSDGFGSSISQLRQKRSS